MISLTHQGCSHGWLCDMHQSARVSAVFDTCKCVLMSFGCVPSLNAKNDSESHWEVSNYMYKDKLRHGSKHLLNGQLCLGSHILMRGNEWYTVVWEIFDSDIFYTKIVRKLSIRIFPLWSFFRSSYWKIIVQTSCAISFLFWIFCPFKDNKFPKVRYFRCPQ